MSDQEALVERIYEAAIVPELWPGVLHDIARLAGCFGGIIFTTTARGITRWTGSDEGKRFFDAFLPNRAAQDDNIRLKRGIEAKHHGFFGTHQLYGRAERESSAVYTEFLLPNGWGYAAGSVLPMPNGDLAVFDLERRFADGPVSDGELAQLNALWPHMARSAALSMRLQLQRARAVVDTLDKAGMPAAILSRQDKILAANSAFEGMKGQVVFLAHGKLALADVASNRLLEQALHAIRASVTTTNSIPIPAQADSSAAVIHALPLPGEASDVFDGARAILIVTRLDRSASPSAEILTGLFDLTPAEATVANRILAGLSVNEIVVERRISWEGSASEHHVPFPTPSRDRHASSGPEPAAALRSHQPDRYAPGGEQTRKRLDGERGCAARTSTSPRAARDNPWAIPCSTIMCTFTIWRVDCRIISMT